MAKVTSPQVALEFQKLLFLFSPNHTADLHCVCMTKMTASRGKCKWLLSASVRCTASTSAAPALLQSWQEGTLIATANRSSE